MKTFCLLLQGIFLCMTIFAQSAAMLSGNITDKNGNQISGVSVSVEGENIQTVSDTSGVFVLHNVPSGKQRILFSFAGYRSNFR